MEWSFLKVREYFLDFLEYSFLQIAGQNGKYWTATKDGVSCESDAGQGFYLELREATKLCIKTSSSQYLNASKNGAFVAGSTEYDDATKWEY